MFLTFNTVYTENNVSVNRRAAQCKSDLSLHVAVYTNYFVTSQFCFRLFFLSFFSLGFCHQSLSRLAEILSSEAFEHNSNDCLFGFFR